MFLYQPQKHPYPTPLKTRDWKPLVFMVTSDIPLFKTNYFQKVNTNFFNFLLEFPEFLGREEALSEKNEFRQERKVRTKIEFAGFPHLPSVS
jgi:hypothetical protein